MDVSWHKVGGQGQGRTAIDRRGSLPRCITIMLPTQKFDGGTRGCPSAEHSRVMYALVVRRRPHRNTTLRPLVGGYHQVVARTFTLANMELDQGLEPCIPGYKTGVLPDKLI